MQKEKRQPPRSQSLNLQKKKNTLQLPRFYSKPKNQSQLNQQIIKNYILKNNKSQKKQKDINNKQQQQIIRKTQINTSRKINFDSPNKKPHSMKKITLSQDKAINIIKYSSVNKKKGLVPVQTIQLSQKQKKLQDNKKQFRSKNIKNSNKKNRQSKLLVNHNQNKIQNKSQKDNFRNPIIFRLPTQIDLRQKSIKDKNLITQGRFKQQLIAQIDKQIWIKICYQLKNMGKSVSDLKSAQDYITSQRLSTQKKIYTTITNTKFKNKLKLHLAMTRIAVYLYVHLMLHNIDVRIILSLLDRLHESHKSIIDILFMQKSTMKLYKLNKQSQIIMSWQQWHIFISKNNQFVQRNLQLILSRKKIPQNDLFKNMLQSSIKIQSFDFLEIIDKTLKWQILKMPSYPYLPITQRQYYLILDLDQTLIHYQQRTQTFHVRPYAQQFILKISKYFQVTIFTAATKQYADQIINQIDQSNNISYRLYRNHLTFTGQTSVKDLALLGRPLHKTIIIDNLSCNFRLQPQNGIQIRSWYGDDDDQILGKLYTMLLKIVDQFKDDLRVGIKHYQNFIKQQISVSQLIYQLKCQL